MKIPLCMIVKDDSEVEQLTACLNTIQPFVDGVYLTKTNETTPKIDKLCKERKINLSYFKWIEDFSAARNFNFSQAPKDADYILWCDADDLWVGADRLKKFAEICKKNEFDVVFFTYYYGCTYNGKPSIESFVEVDIKQMRERLIKPNTNTWKGRLHETPVPLEGVKLKYTHIEYLKDAPICVLHTATNEVLPEKQARNQRILELQLEEERKKGEADPRTLLYLMKIYAESDDPQVLRQVEPMGQEYLQKSGWNEERGVCLDIMASVQGKLGSERKAVEFFHLALREWPYLPIFYLHLARAYYNLGLYREAKHWLEMGMKVEIKSDSGHMLNMLEMKLLSAELLLNIKYNVEKDIEGAVKAAELLFKENPTPKNEQNLTFLMDLKDLNDACANIHKISNYFESIGDKKSIVRLVDALPDAIKTQPFAVKLRQKNTKPRKWKDNEICYFANFGQKHFEKWSPESMKKGIGGSETAVIRLSQEWTKRGYKVTVYGDPEKSGDYDGVTYLPWYHFNYKDKFNIFIQWRNWNLCKMVKAKKFLVDLHDVYSMADIKPEQLEKIDAFMVKSKFHRNLAPHVADKKFINISNGI